MPDTMFAMEDYYCSSRNLKTSDAVFPSVFHWKCLNVLFR